VNLKEKTIKKISSKEVIITTKIITTTIIEIKIGSRISRNSQTNMLLRRLRLKNHKLPNNEKYNKNKKKNQLPFKVKKL